MIDEKGRLFGKLNIVDLLVILVVLVAVVVLGALAARSDTTSSLWMIGPSV